MKRISRLVPVLGASVLLPFLPMAPLQVLLNTLLYDCSQTALTTDRVDPGSNRLRQALRIGFPRLVRLRLHDGFAGLDVEFGGLASLARIEGLRGIPIGPAAARYFPSRSPARP